MLGPHGRRAALRMRMRPTLIALRTGLLIGAACLLLPGAALGQVVSQTRSPAAAGNCTNQAGIGTIAWGSTGNAISSNASYATATVDGETTNYLRCLNYGFTIPVGATIVGIEVNVERKSNRTQNGGSEDAAMRLVKAGAIQATDRSTGTTYTTGDVVEAHGGATDLWGSTWTPADINAANFGAAFAATKPDPSGQPHDITVDHIQITVYYTVPSTPGSFNAFETGTGLGAITGPIQTKVSGVAFSLDVVAILSGAQLAGFNSAVTVELLGNTTLGVALDAQNCPTSSTLIQTVSPAPTISGGRSTVNFAAVANVWRDVRVRVRYPTASPTVTSCSTDNFAIRPASLSAAVTDSNWTTAGTTRTLNNTGAVGGNVHKAGQPFTIRVTPAPATATNYNGDATVSALATTLPAGGASGTLSLGTFASVGSGVRETTTASYNEVGAFNLTLIDDTFASVDASDGTPADCTATGRYVCHSGAPLGVGRFVPDHFAFTIPGGTTPPQFRTFDMTCAAARSFTYVGAPFGYVTRPTATVEARNAAGNVTTNYRDPAAGGLFKLTAAGLTQNYTMTGQTITTTLSAPALTAVGNGTATFTASTNDRIAIQRNTATASAPLTGAIELRWIAQDNSEVVLNGTITTSPSTGFVFNGAGSGIPFDDAGTTTGEFRYGRLRLANANGSQLTALPVVMEAQYYNGTTFITNVADNCTPIANNNVAFAFSGNLGACETAVSGGGTLASGRRTLVLSSPGAGNDGAATLTVNLSNAALGNTCTAVGGAGPATTGANQAWLQGNWTGGAYTVNPTGRATFGVFRGSDEVIFIRENF